MRLRYSILLRAAGCIVLSGLAVLCISSLLSSHNGSGDLMEVQVVELVEEATSAETTEGAGTTPAPWTADASGRYAVRRFAAEGASWSALSARPHATCLAVHVTLSHAYHVGRQAAAWGGPVSAAFFSGERDVRLVMAYVEFLRRCRPHVRDKVAFHVICPSGEPVGAGWDGLQADCSETDEQVAERLSALQTQPVGEQLLYPQNLARNTARLSCATNLTVCPDADMLPSGQPDVYRALAAMFDRQPPCHKCAYVLPVFEIKDAVKTLPKDKSELYQMSRQKNARPYHWEVLKHDQRLVDPHRWIKYKSNSSSIGVAYQMKYDWPGEPVYVAHRMDLPIFDEMFVGYGNTRNTQVFEMFASGWQFYVLDNAFLIHRGFQTKKQWPKWRFEQMEANKVLKKEWAHRVAMQHGHDVMKLEEMRRRKKKPARKSKRGKNRKA